MALYVQVVDSRILGSVGIGYKDVRCGEVR
jgi:hypothetical protein